MWSTRQRIETSNSERVWHSSWKPTITTLPVRFTTHSLLEYQETLSVLFLSRYFYMSALPCLLSTGVVNDSDY